MNAPLRTCCRFVRETSGGAMVEMTVILPLAIFMMVGGVEFGRAFSAYNTADKAIHNATRYLAKVPGGGICTGSSLWGYANASNLAMYGTISPNDDSPPLVSGWSDPATITWPTPTACTSFGESEVVELNAAVPIQLMMLAVIPGLSNNITVNVHHEERHVGE